MGIGAALIAKYKISKALIGFLANQGLGASQSAFLEPYLQNRIIKRAMKKSVRSGIEEFLNRRPGHSHIVFHFDRFFKPQILPQIAKILHRTEKPNIRFLVLEYEKAFGSSDGINEVMIDLVESISVAFKNNPNLNQLLNSVQIEEVHHTVHVGLVPSTKNLEEKTNQIYEMLKKPSIPQPLQKIFDHEALKRTLNYQSIALLAWPQTLSGNQWIERPELGKLIKTITDNECSTTVMVGRPGSGKSALLSRLGEQLKNDGVPLLAIKADMLPPSIGTNIKLQEWLGLPELTHQCIQGLADKGKIVLLLDQLDALCDLIDLHTERLSVLINLVRNVSNVKNIHVIISSRDFEYSHDVRFQQIDGDELRLGLPTWDDVLPILKYHEIDPSGWPKTFCEMLCTPQHLNVFLRFFTKHPQPVFTSYQSMLEEVWQKNIVEQDQGAECSDLTKEIAVFLAEKEMFWAPSARYDDRFKIIEMLVSSGILAFNVDRTTVGFAHQTLFDFARAKAFAAEQAKLSEYVLARQDALFIRPTLWSSLNYLRSVNKPNYYREFSRLWNEEGLRTHIRFLLMEFLGNIDDPDGQEITWLVPYLDDAKWTKSTLAVMQGSPGWFDALKDTYLPKLMKGEAASAWQGSYFLAKALHFARDEVINLITDNWLPFQEKDDLSLHVLNHLSEWSEIEFSVVEQIINRQQLPFNRWIEYILSSVSESLPHLAPKLVLAYYTIKRTEALRLTESKSSKIEKEDLDNGELGEIEKLWLKTDFLAKAPIHNLIESDDFYDLPFVAENAPVEFIDVMFPLFVDVLELIARDMHPFINQYRDDSCLDTGFYKKFNDREHYSLLYSIRSAILAIGHNEPDKFMEFVQQWKSSDLQTVQRLISIGLLELAEAKPEYILSYLLEDPRRLVIGNHENEHLFSEALILAVAPQLNVGQIEQLEDHISSWSYYGEFPEDFTPKDKFQRHKRNRGHRLRLLRAIPESKRSDKAKQIMKEEMRALEVNADQERQMPVDQWIRSPLSKEQMEKAGDQEIIKLLSELYDDTGLDHPKQILVGGSIQASNEFGRFASDNPDRAIALFDNFEPGLNERPVSTALREMAKTKVITIETLSELILNLSARGFQSIEFRQECAYALAELIKEPEGLQDDICQHLRGWLKDFEGNLGSVENVPESEQDIESILWRHRTFHLLPHGNWPILYALKKGYLLRRPCAYDGWLKVLEERLERPENPAVWKSLAPDLQWLHDADRKSSERIIEVFLNRHVKDTKEGVLLAAYVIRWVSSETIRPWLLSLLTDKWILGPQAFGELIMLGALISPDDQRSWYVEQVQNFLIGSEAKEMQSANVRLGISYSAINLWPEEGFKSYVTPILTQLLVAPLEAAAHTVLEVFKVVVKFHSDEHTKQLLDAILAHPQVLSSLTDYFSLEKLMGLLPIEAGRVCDFCFALLDQRGAEIANIQGGLAGCAEDLINISMTLQRLLDYREKGLTLFEKLLELDIYGVNYVLFELDRRPHKTVPQRPLRRRRRHAQIKH